MDLHEDRGIFPESEPLLESWFHDPDRVEASAAPAASKADLSQVGPGFVEG